MARAWSTDRAHRAFSPTWASHGGRIAAIEPPGTVSATRVIDATDLVLAPGFIDMHSHSDLRLLAEPDHLAKVSQGVTLEVLGQDGLSYAPVDDAVLATLREQLAGWNGDPDGFDWNWRSVGEYLDRLDQGIAVNAAYLVPQGTLRMLHVGWDDRTGHRGRTRRHVGEPARPPWREGAVGLSSGLTYTPGMYADDDELVALCAVVAEHGGYYSPHHRSYGAGALAGVRGDDRGLPSAPAARCTWRTRRMNFPENAGRAGELLTLLDDAIAAGADVTLDTYPYLPGATYLSALLPSWATEGGPHGTVERLSDPDTWSGSGRTSRSAARTAATACRSTGTRSRSTACATRATRTWSVTPSATPRGTSACSRASCTSTR